MGWASAAPVVESNSRYKSSMYAELEPLSAAFEVPGCSRSIQHARLMYFTYRNHVTSISIS